MQRMRPISPTRSSWKCGTSTASFWQLHLAHFGVWFWPTVDSVYPVSRPQTVAGYDRDQLDGEKWVVYGAGNRNGGKRYIRAHFSSGALQELRNPQDQDFTGMAADSKRLWVFRFCKSEVWNA